MHRRLPIKSRWLVLAAAALVSGACVSPPRAVGPTMLAGPLPQAREGATATAQRAASATDGPLRVRDASFVWTHAATTEATYSWSCTVENPAAEGFRVTVVVQLLDRHGRRLAATNQTLQIDGKSAVPVTGQGLVDAPASGEVSSWRLEYWVEARARPVRD